MASSERRISMDASGKYSGGELPPESPFDLFPQDNMASPTIQSPSFQIGSSSFDFQTPVSSAVPVFQVPSSIGSQYPSAFQADQPPLFDVGPSGSWTSAQLEGATTKVSRLEEEAKDRKAEIKALENENSVLKGWVASRDRKNEELRKKQETLNDALRQANDLMEQVNKELTEQREYVEELETSNAWYEEEASHSPTSFALEEEVDTRLEEERRAWELEKGELNRYIEDRDTRIADAVTEIVSLENRKKQEYQALDKRKSEEYISLESRKNQELVQVSAERERLKKQGRDIIAQRDNTIEALQQHIAGLEAGQKHTIEAQLRRITELEAEQKTALIPTETYKKESEETIREKAHTIKAQGRRISELTDVNRNAKDLNDTLKQRGEEDTRQFKATIEAQVQQIAQLEADNKSALARNESMKGSDEITSEKDKIIEEQKERISELTDANNNAAHLNDTLRKNVEETVQNCNATNNAQAQRLDQLEAEKREIIQQSEAQRTWADKTIHAKDNNIANQTTIMESQTLELNKAGTYVTECQARERTMMQEGDAKLQGLQRELQDCQDRMEELRVFSEAKDAEIIKLKTISDESGSEDVALLKKKIKDQQKWIEDFEGALQKAHFAGQAREEECTELRVEYAELRNKYGELQAEADGITQKYERKIEKHKGQLLEKDDAIEELRGIEATHRKEADELQRELKELKENAKAHANTEKDLSTTIENGVAALNEKTRIIEDLRSKNGALEVETKQLADEIDEITEHMGGDQTDGKADFDKKLQFVTKHYDEKIMELNSKFDYERAKDAEKAEQEFALLEEAKAGLEGDVNRLQHWVEESRQTTDDLEQEVKAARRAGMLTHGATEEITNGQGLGLSPVPNELGPSSTSGFPAGEIRGLGGSTWIRRPGGMTLESDDDESEDEQPIIRRYRRRYSIDVDMTNMKDASTQTDRLPTGPTSMVCPEDGEPAASNSAVPIKLDHKPALMIEMGTQTMMLGPELSEKPTTPKSTVLIKLDQKRATAEAATQTVPSRESGVANGVTQTTPVPKQTPLWWRLLRYLLVLLVFILIFLAASWWESACRERGMWLDANYRTRSAVLSIRGGGGTGTRRPAWLWKEPLMGLPKQYS